jgi:LysM repeat protein
MDLHRRPLLFLTAVLLFLVYYTDVRAAGYDYLAATHPLMGRVAMPAGGMAGAAVLLAQDSTVAGRTTSRTPRSTYVPNAGGSGGGTCGSTVTARPGDTMSSIARRCGVPPSTLAYGNRLRTNSVLGVGQTLVLPGARAPAPVPTRVPARPTQSYYGP